METWLKRLFKKNQLQVSSQGTPGSPGGGNVGAPTFPGMATVFTPNKKKRRRKKDDDKKIKPDPFEGYRRSNPREV